MIRIQDIRSLSDFQRNAKSTIRRLKRTKRPEILTVQGRAEIVVQDARAYQEILDRLEESETLAGIRRGLEDLDAGRGRPAGDVLADLRRAAPQE
jgi:PHD/YefM family antitoxin component YafN of YafNO toxin-antitoxin module